MTTAADALGRPLQVGDRISYAMSSGHGGPYLNFYRILEIVHQPTKLGSPIKLKCEYIGGYNYVDTHKEKRRVSMLSYSDERSIKLGDEDVVPADIRDGKR